MSTPKKILITKGAGFFARSLIDELLKTPNFSITSVDERPLSFAHKNLQHHQLDLRRKSAFELLRAIKPDIIIHLGVVRNPQKHRKKRENPYYFNLETTTQVLNLAQSVSAEKLLFLSSANLYGPSQNTCGFLNEDAPLHGASKSPEFRDLVAIDMMVQSFFWKMPQTKTIIFRPCHIVGKGLKNAPSKYFDLESIPYIFGFDPILQLIHPQDVIQAFKLALKKDVQGVFNLAGTGTAPLSMILKELHKKLIPLPQRVLQAVMTTTFFSKQSNFPVAELDHLKYSCLIDDARARQILGFKPKVSIKKILKPFAL